MEFITALPTLFFTCFEKLKSGAVSKRLSLKPLGTQNSVENGLTTQKALLDRQGNRADFQQIKLFLKRKKQTAQETKARFSQTKITRN
ncbi:hypothetical protein KY022_004620 [Vibrio parahaemolyticus]|nr:hypothetical protein [Vibrio parahaemolyticus]